MEKDFENIKKSKNLTFLSDDELSINLDDFDLLKTDFSQQNKSILKSTQKNIENSSTPNESSNKKTSSNKKNLEFNLKSSKYDTKDLEIEFNSTNMTSKMIGSTNTLNNVHPYRNTFQSNKIFNPVRTISESNIHSNANNKNLLMKSNNTLIKSKNPYDLYNNSRISNNFPSFETNNLSYNKLLSSNTILNQLYPSQTTSSNNNLNNLLIQKLQKTGIIGEEKNGVFLFFLLLRIPA